MEKLRPVDPLETQSGRVEMILRLCEEYRRQTNADIQAVLAEQIHEVAYPVVVGRKPGVPPSHYTVPVIATEKQIEVGEKEIALMRAGGVQWSGAGVANLYAMMVLASPEGLAEQKRRGRPEPTEDERKELLRAEHGMPA